MQITILMMPNILIHSNSNSEKINNHSCHEAESEDLFLQFQVRNCLARERHSILLTYDRLVTKNSVRNSNHIYFEERP